MRISEILSNVKTIMKREIKGYFESPLAYVFIVIFLLLIGFFTFNVTNFYENGQADLRAFFYWHPWLYLFLIPAAAMRLWSEEMRMKTIELLLTFPVSVGEVICGKFLAAWLFIGICLGLTFPMVLTVAYLGDPDLGAILCAYIGSFLMAGAYLSVGIMTSSFTPSQVISFVLAVVICLFFLLAGFSPVIDMVSGWAPQWFVEIVTNLSFLTHYNSIQRGVIDFRDILYYFSVIVLMIFANALVIQNRKAA